MANVELLEPFIKKWEGGWSDHPADRGGKTMCGVTLATWQVYCRNHGRVGTAENLREITQEEWREILKTMYWDRIQGDRINSQSVANIWCDWVWASGSYGITNVQRILGGKVDGIVGMKTLNAANRQKPKELFLAIQRERVAFVDRVIKADTEKAVFRNGWLNRINDFTYEG